MFVVFVSLVQQGMRRGTNVSVEMSTDKREFPRAFSCQAEQELRESLRDFDLT